MFEDIRRPKQGRTRQSGTNQVRAENKPNPCEPKNWSDLLLPVQFMDYPTHEPRRERWVVFIQEGAVEVEGFEGVLCFASNMYVMCFCGSYRLPTTPLSIVLQLGEHVAKTEERKSFTKQPWNQLNVIRGKHNRLLLTNYPFLLFKEVSSIIHSRASRHEIVQHCLLPSVEDDIDEIMVHGGGRNFGENAGSDW